MIIRSILSYLAWLVFYVVMCFFLWFGGVYYVIGVDITNIYNIILLYTEFLETNMIFILVGTFLSQLRQNKKKY